MHGPLLFAKMAAVESDADQIRDNNESVQPVEAHRIPPENGPNGNPNPHFAPAIYGWHTSFLLWRLATKPCEKCGLNSKDSKQLRAFFCPGKRRIFQNDVFADEAAVIILKAQFQKGEVYSREVNKNSYRLSSVLYSHEFLLYPDFGRSPGSFSGYCIGG
jgi:hypothetical protein